MSPSRNGRMLFLLLTCLLLAGSIAVGLGLGANTAIGDQAQTPSESLAPTPAQTKALLESGRASELVEDPETDLHAAQTMPHSDLDRGEALELAEAVFEPELESLGGIYDQLEPERFLSDYAAVVSVSSLPEEPGQPNDGLAAEHPDTPVLVESMLPLRTEGPSGDEEAVDLGLERSEGELQPQNPLTAVGIPDQLGEGISLPGSEIELTVAGAPEERSATDAGGEFAFYPEVAEDTDLIVAPTPRGVETMTDIRSAAAPTQTTYDLGLPAGAELRATNEGGAEVVEGDHPTLLIPAPTATDAAGNPVQTEMTVSGERITVAVTPSLSTAFPILVDPTYITEGWRWTLNHDSMAAWRGTSTNWNAMEAIPYEAWQPANQYPGLDLTSANWGGSSVWGTHADWKYWVPRYEKDLATYHTPPTSWVYQMWSEGVLFLPYGNNENYPALVMGLVDPNYGWEVSGVHYGGQGEMNNWNNLFVFTNEYEQTGDKGADMNLVTYQAETPPKRRDTYMADAYISVVDSDAPRILELNPPQRWMNTTAEPISYEFEDQGLGVRSAGMTFNGTALPGWGFDLLCSATTASPCPRVARSTETHVPLAYYPGNLPTGKDWLTVTAGDVMWGLGVAGHTTSGNVLVKVDHAAPEITLAGSLTEQGSLGTNRPSYALRINAKDGVAGAPQSGVKKVEVLVDGKRVVMPEESEWEPNCQSENCSFNGEWTMNASEYSAGAHEVKVIATDAVGIVSTKTLQVELHPPAPTLTASGSLTEQGTLGTERPGYKLNINASALAESPTPAAIPTYSSAFGGPGTGNGQFARPGSMAIDAQGNLWVADSNNNRVEKFNEKGEYLSQFGTKGSGDGQFSRPTAVAVAANGNLWVTDSGNKRVEEFTPAGAYLAKFGSAGTGNGQFAGSGPEALAIDFHGNIWVTDTYGGRLEKFNESGAFIRSVASKGKGPEQLGQPDGIAIAPGGNVYVTDWEDDKVAEYGEGGKFIRQFGSEGGEPGQLQNPTGIAVDSRGDVWVPDQNNGRVEEFNQGGEYLGRFGAKGTGAGQFELSYPTGIATDAKGDIWVTDAGGNRIEKWVSAGYGTPAGPTFVRSIGSAGTTPGHFQTAMGVAVDPKGNVWAVDQATNVLQKFGTAGEFLASYGGPGSGNGQFSAPTPLAISGGHIWVGDVGNGRIEEFNESGGYIGKFGVGGSGAGQIAWPGGIAVDPNHHVWVAELMGSRVQEFTETGALLRTIPVGRGVGNGSLPGATGIAVGPGNRIWVSVYGENKIEELSETGEVLRQFGGVANELGHVVEPMGIYVDAAEHVWVADRGHSRIVEFNGKGEYLGNLGVPGPGVSESGGGQPGTINSPNYVAVDTSGHLFLSNTGDMRLDEWTLPVTHSQISTEITVDGRRYDAGEAGCSTETCSTSREWTLEASKFSPGTHVVVVRATDGLGNTTTKTLNIKTGDTTKPGLEVGGELATAPEGWIEQAEGNYGLHATATDSGYGVTSLIFSLDGKAVAEKTQSCVAGACSATITATVNAHGLAAGAHQAKVLATDGAGNSTVKEWTVNVDPEGEISVAEAEATIEAVEKTAGDGLAGVESILSPSEGETSPGVGTPVWGSIPVTETEVPTSISQNPAQGVEYEIADDSLLSQGCPATADGSYPGRGEPAETELEEGKATSGPGCEPDPEERQKLEEEQRVEEEEVAEGRKAIGREPITITPLNVSGESSAVTGVDGSATLAANIHGEVDTVFRPMSAGGYTFETIRSAAAPEHYSYELDIYEQELVQASPDEIWVKYIEGGPVAFTITAMPVHDAIGSTVPTHLAVTSSNVITLTVEHRGPSPAGGSFVYPVVAGTGWEGGYRTISVVLAEPPPPPPEEPGQEGTVTDEGDFFRTRVAVVGPGVADAYQLSQKSEPHNPAHWFAFSECIDGKAKAIMEEVVRGAAEDVRIPDATLVGNCAKLTPMKHTWRGTAVRGWVHVNSSGWVWINDPAHQMECPTWGMGQIAMVHCYVHPQKVHGELTVGGDFRTAVGSWFPEMADCLTVYGHIRPAPPYMVPQETIDTQRLKGEKCDWPAE